MFIFSTPVLIRQLWQLKTVSFLHWGLICAVLLPIPFSQNICFKPFFPHLLRCVSWRPYLYQGILKREVSLYHWPPVWLAWISLFWKLKQKLSVVITAYSKPVKQEVNCTVILPPLVFPASTISLQSHSSVSGLYRSAITGVPWCAPD